MRDGVIIENVKHVLHFGKEAAKLKNRIRELRRAMGLTQDELAGALSVTRQTVIAIEKGTYCASLPLAHRIAVFFGESIESIFIFDEEEQ